MFASRLIPISILFLASSVGCAALQDAEFAVCNWASAEKTWLTCTTSAERWSISSDYRKGWKEGYRAQLNGTGCYDPPGPPPCYWSPKYRTCEGKAAVEQWYCGWHAGVAAAVDKGDYRIPIGNDPPRLLHSNRKGCAVQEGCNGAVPCYSPQQDGFVASQYYELTPGAEQLPSPDIAPSQHPIVPLNSPSDVQPSLQPNSPPSAVPNVLPEAVEVLPEAVQPVTPLSIEEAPGLIGPFGSIFDQIPDYTAQNPYQDSAANP